MKLTRLFKTAALAAAIAACGTQADAQILYKVEKPGSDKTSYILGTHHFASLACVDSIAELPSILKSVDKLYGELDMSAMTDPQQMMAMQGKIMAPADSTLDKVLTPAQLDSLSNFLTSIGGNGAMLQMMYPMKPAVIGAQVAQLISMKTFPDLNPMEGIDMTMQNRARELGKPVQGLETLDFQMDMLYNTPISKQVKGLLETMRSTEKEVEMGVKLSEAYKNHDFDSILAIMQEASDDDPEEIERILYSRNRNWIKQLSDEMPATSLMVVVGAGHLPGDKGVLKGLEAKGFKVTPVR